MIGVNLKIGLPSKGRLQAQVADFLSEHGVDFVKSSVEREYAGGLSGVDNVEVVLISAGEAPQKLARGEVHLAVTGEDLVRERAGAGPQLAPEKLTMLRPLGFGHADLIVAVPKCWIDVDGAADLDDVAADFRERHGHPLRVATKYPRLTRRYFREKGVGNYRLLESQGATEGLVAARAAEAVVDITSSGETLRANHLKILSDGVILRSEAQLCASLTADWSERALGALRPLLALLGDDGQGAQAEAALVTAEITAEAWARARPALGRRGAAQGEFRPDGVAALPVEMAQAAAVAEILTAAGAAKVTIEPVAAAPSVSGSPDLFAAFSRLLAAGD